jgi:hypothetical protein
MRFLRFGRSKIIDLIGGASAESWRAGAGGTVSLSRLEDHFQDPLVKGRRAFNGFGGYPLVVTVKQGKHL